MSSHHQLKPQFFLDALYCEESEPEYSSSAVDIDNNNNDNNCDDDEDDALNYHNAPPVELEQNNLWEIDAELTSLLHKEQENQLQASGVDHSASFAKARADAVEWMLRVVDYYSFSPLTALLAVNYFDRFLLTFESHNDKPWMAQLAAVACISLAAKVEETHVPLLLDLQVEESDYVFESKTIQRMEILVLSTLNWKMNPVTSISFLDCIAAKLGLFSHISREFLRRCHCLLLSLASDCRFMRYLPSALATATMLYVIRSVDPTIGVQRHDQLIAILGINKEMVENCCRLIQEVATSADFSYSCNKRKVPGSPKGVVDVCFSSGDSSAASSPAPLLKKLKSK